MRTVFLPSSTTRSLTGQSAAARVSDHPFFYHFLPGFLGHDFCYHADVSRAHTGAKQCGTAALSLTTRSNNMTSFLISDVANLPTMDRHFFLSLKNNAARADKLSLSLLGRLQLAARLLTPLLANAVRAQSVSDSGAKGKGVGRKRHSSLLVTCHFTTHEVSGELCLILFLDTVTADVKFCDCDAEQNTPPVSVLVARYHSEK